MAEGKEQLFKFQKRWQLLLYAEILLYVFAVFFFTYFIFLNSIGSLIFAIVIGVLLVFYKNPWSRDINKTVNYIDANFKEASYSSGLLLVAEEQLSNLSKLQKHRVSHQLSAKLENTSPPNNVKRAILSSVILVALGYLGYNLGIFQGVPNSSKSVINNKDIHFTPLDSLNNSTKQRPELTGQKISIAFPYYTHLPKTSISDPNIKTLVNSTIFWQLEFEGEVSEVVMEFMGNSYPLVQKKEGYEINLKAEMSGYYNFKFKDLENISYTSDLYALEVVEDEVPSIEISGISQYTYFDFEDNKQFAFQTSITDDYGIADAYIIATVSKGTGESVKFREEKIDFNAAISIGAKHLQLSKKIVLNDLKMEIGDELYFYIEALDQKLPKLNKARSETYFVVIKDTASNQFAVEGTMGVDQLPDYFRSQRQLIIDTEKLIKDRSKLTTKDFNFKSNELGFDQKALRLKYGQFMGDESEMELASNDNVVEETEHEESDDDNENLLEKYTHDHDGSNEQHLVPEKDLEKNDPLHDYVHNHEDPEASTLFEESLKTKLRKALTIMWDAELHLRLYNPEKSLPYQYKALELIQEIKNSARIYVHRIGFDPPPIKEDKRLVGDIKDIKNFQKNESTLFEQTMPFIRKAVARLESLIERKIVISAEDQVLFNNAGNELAEKAILEPGKYLTTLRELKQLIENAKYSTERYRLIQKSLMSALPKAEKNPGLEVQFQDQMNTLFLKELNNYE